MSSPPIKAIIIMEQFRKSISHFILEESEDEELEEEAVFMQMVLTEQEHRLQGTRNKPARLENYVERVVPSYSISTFRSHFRMTPAAVDHIENILSPILSRQGPIGRFTIKPRTQVLSVIWLLATPDSYRSIGEMFGLSKSTLHHCFRRVIYALYSIVKSQIFWPQGHQKQIVQHRFERISDMPCVIGAIDGCQIEIDAPQENPAAYRTGKKRYAIQLQAVCSSDLIIMDAFAGYPGSVHDARVFKNSPLHRNANSIFTDSEYIIGDKAYPVRTWCIPPYKNYGNLTETELTFNKKLSATRQVIERCFSLLKGRFRRLKHLCMYRTDEISIAIMASCVLHNICLRGLYDEPDHIEQYIEEGSQQEVINNDSNDGSNYIDDERSEEAINKRNLIRDMVTQH